MAHEHHEDVVIDQYLSIGHSNAGPVPNAHNMVHSSGAQHVETEASQPISELFGALREGALLTITMSKMTTCTMRKLTQDTIHRHRLLECIELHSN